MKNTEFETLMLDSFLSEDIRMTKKDGVVVGMMGGLPLPYNYFITVFMQKLLCRVGLDRELQDDMNAKLAAFWETTPLPNPLQAAFDKWKGGAKNAPSPRQIASLHAETIWDGLFSDWTYDGLVEVLEGIEDRYERLNRASA